MHDQGGRLNSEGILLLRRLHQGRRVKYCFAANRYGLQRRTWIRLTFHPYGVWSQARGPDSGRTWPVDTIQDHGYEESFLERTDLIFVDAISTGYRRPVPGENPAQFHGVIEDAKLLRGLLLPIHHPESAVEFTEVSDR
jgi:hypothetical protein